tara:strand:+ start:773 stop:1801 length:1029 start_codon:yes stop_codon:yes gene_type:complete
VKITSLKEIREVIHDSENPLIIFDDDPDGLVSFLLIRKYFGRGEGFIAKSHLMDDGVIQKIKSYSPDLLIILDVPGPTIEQEFIDAMDMKIVYIDHHEVPKLKGVKYYYNPILENKEGPTSYWCWLLVEKEYLWLATVGVVSDWSLLTFKEFKKKFPDLVEGVKGKKPPEVLFDSKIGKLARIFSFILKGKVQDAMLVADLLLKVDDPYEILEQKSDLAKKLYRKYEKIERVYDSLLERANNVEKDRLLLFVYQENVSLSTNLSNELVYRNPKSVVIVAREKEDYYVMSCRSSEKDVELPKIIEKLKKKFPGSFGGGHPHAIGGGVKKEDFEEFIELFKKEI